MRSLFRKIREANRPFCTALVAAAGSSSRMGGVDKLMEFLDGVPVLIRTLTALQRAESIDEIVIAVREDALVDISTLCKTYGITKCSKVVRGGESRCHSVLLAALEASPEAKLLSIHDHTLHIDCGDAAVNESLHGYYSVLRGYGYSALFACK